MPVQATDDVIIYALQGSTPDIGLHGSELRKRLKFAGYTFVNAASFYNHLARLKKEGKIGGGMINNKRCYWQV